MAVRSEPRGRRLGRLERPALQGVLVREHAGREAIEVYGPPVRLAQVEQAARAAGIRTRRTGTSVSLLGAEALNGDAPEGERRATTLEDVFVLLTGEEVA